MNRRARPRRPRPRNDHIEIMVHRTFIVGRPSVAALAYEFGQTKGEREGGHGGPPRQDVQAALSTRRYGKRRSIKTSRSPARCANARNSSDLKLRRIDNAPSCRNSRLCKTNFPNVV